MKPQICKNCEYFKRLHIRTWYNYYAIHKYFCALRGEVKEAEHTCDKWQQKLKREPNLSCERFEKAEQDIKTLLSYLEDVNI